jgi:hypothetical protein
MAEPINLGWPRPAGGEEGVAMSTSPLDPPALLSELDR